jgi:hypothetical protein
VGYLDKQSRVIDVILTERGRKLFAVGRLDFTYFGLFDDCLDYDPTSGQEPFSDEERDEQIQATLMLEAPFVKDVRGSIAPLEPLDHIFTAAAGYRVIPTMVSPVDGDSTSLMADQRVDSGVYRRTGTSFSQINPVVTGDVERGNPGFVVRVFSSGSTGLRPLGFRHDLSSRRAADPFVAVAVDSELLHDAPRLSAPDSSRVSDSTDSRKR